MRPSRTLALASVLILAACSSWSRAETVRVPLTMTEMAYSTRVIEVPAGQKITIELLNSGKVDHDLVITALKLQVFVKPGRTAVRTIGPIPEGAYEVYCSIPTHREAGMTAALIAR